MYESLLNVNKDEAAAAVATLPGGQDPALVHAGDCRRVLRIHEKHVAARLASAPWLVGADAGAGVDHDADVGADTGEGGDEDAAAVPPVGPRLMGRIADARMLRTACAALARRGCTAAGPGGLALHELDDVDRWTLCRMLADSLKKQTYRPMPYHVLKVPKEGGPPGRSRKLTIQSTADRIVAKAAAMVLAPVVDPQFCPFSFGFRPGCCGGTHTALATAIALAESQGRWTWVTADLAQAFDRVPFRRLLDAAGLHFPADVVAFIDLLAGVGTRHGLPQGSPDSPVLFNLFADHFLDRPWHRRHVSQPLFRYVDDLLVLCASAAEATERYAELNDLATRSAGTPLKEATTTPAIVDLAAGGEVVWLGYLLRREDQPQRLAIRIAAKAWDRLAFGLAKAHLTDAAPLRAAQVVRGWVDWLGPCFASENRRAVLDRVRDVAAEHAFDEVPDRDELATRWGAAHARWHRLGAQEAEALPARLAALAEYAARRRPKGWKP